ncbi:MAG: murein biosynthesis integral membrane protein MurJ [Actinobacteria bacterium]|nr:murein biosynthesis integral membrane protein MurJ [Actinomycetota bacterium]
MDAPRDLLRTNVAVAAGTAVSRVTGLARIVVFGMVIGQTAVADAYDGANNSPNSIYELLMGGVFSAALVPVFTRLFHDDDDEAQRAVVATALVSLAALTAVAVACAPLIFRLFSLNPAAGIDVVAYRNLGTMLARVFLLQIFFYGLTALATAALNARRKFVAAAWAPVAANVVIVVLLALIPLSIDGRPGLDTIADNSTVRWLLGGGATLGIATTAVIVLAVARASGASFGLRADFRHPAVRRLARLSLWTFGYVLTNQVALVVVRNLAEPGSGGPDAYTKAFTFFQLPHALLAASITTTFAPDLARAAASADRQAFVGRLSLGVRLITLLTLPAASLFFVTSRPMIGALLQHGNFTAEAAHNTARALMGFSVGLVGFSVYLFVLRGFYAREDTRTPFVINCFENVVNVVLAIILVDRHGVLGLGLAFGIAYLVSAIVALVVIERRHPEFASLALMRSLCPMLAATAPASLAAWAIGRALGDTEGLGAVARTAASYAVGVVVYVGFLRLLRVRETTALADRLRGLNAGR